MLVIITVDISFFPARIGHPIKKSYVIMHILTALTAKKSYGICSIDVQIVPARDALTARFEAAFIIYVAKARKTILVDSLFQSTFETFRRTNPIDEVGQHSCNVR